MRGKLIDRIGSRKAPQARKGVVGGMGNKDQFIDVVCFSEKANVSIGFGFSLEDESAEIRRQNATDLINECASDTFWENYEEFEPGIEKARWLFNNGTFSSLRDALFEVFGHFQLRFEIAGVDMDFDGGVDPDELMYSLLKEA